MEEGKLCGQHKESRIRGTVSASGTLVCSISDNCFVETKRTTAVLQTFELHCRKKLSKANHTCGVCCNVRIQNEDYLFQVRVLNHHEVRTSDFAECSVKMQKCFFFLSLKKGGGGQGGGGGGGVKDSQEQHI
jgi:hypothetical protein